MITRKHMITRKCPARTVLLADLLSSQCSNETRADSANVAESQRLDPSDNLNLVLNNMDTDSEVS